MKANIIYVIISGEKDTYFEQVWASAWSLKYHTPDAKVTVLTDEATKKSIYSESRRKSLEVLDEIVVVDFDKEYSNKEKSRWIKTNMRNLIKGDFLFIDADTIITDDISDIDNLSCSVGAVLDYNCQTTNVCDNPIFRIMYNDRLKSVFGVDYYPEKNNVFNSGVMYVKDDDFAHNFFDAWHRNWLRSLSKGYVVDQLPLVKTCMDLDNPITEISGVYNCQVRVSIQYLFNAKIVHTYATLEKSVMSPILGPEIYVEMKEAQSLTENVKDLLLHCREHFISPTILVDKYWLNLHFQPATLFIDEALKSNSKFDRFAVDVMNFISRAFGYIKRHIAR